MQKTIGPVLPFVLLAILPCAGRTQTPPPAPSTAATSPAPTRSLCAIHKDPPSEAEEALAREDYDAAATLYKAMADKAPDESREGEIRVLIEQNKTGEAETLARAWTKDQPSDAAAEETLAEVLLREAQVGDALTEAQRAQKLNPCYARIYLTIGTVWHMAGLFASARKNFEQAHALSPNDIEVRHAWIGTLPKDRRIEEYTAQLKDKKQLNAKDASRLEESLAHAKDYHATDCRQDTPPEKARIPIRAIMNGPTNREGLALDVFFNGKRRRLEVDTGASGIVLSREAAASLGLTREQKIETGGVGDQGDVSTAIAHVESLKIGNLEFKNCPVELLEKRGRLDIDGLIGGNFFSSYLVSLDFPGLELRLDPIPKRPDEKPAEADTVTGGSDDTDEQATVVHDRFQAPEMKDWTRIFRVGHMLLLPVNIGQSKDMLFLVDTGAGLMSISPAAAQQVTKVGRDYDMQVQGIGGKVNKVYSTESFTLRFANLGQKVDSMTAFDTTSLSHNAGTEISGFLGAPILNRMTLRIDYRDNLIKFDYDRGKDPVR